MASNNKSANKRDKSESAAPASRRRIEENGNAKPSESSDNDMEADDDGLVFEDPFGDEFEEENFDDDDELGDDNDENDDNIEGADDDDQDGMMETEASEAPKQVWRPGVDRLEEGETLEYDPSAYVMYHSLRTEWPCLSFDFLRDNLGEGRQRVRIFIT